MTVVAKLDNAKKTYTVGDEVVVAVNNVNMQFQAGELACIYGASGSGKTTMLNILAGIDIVDSGDVYAVGQMLSGRSESDRADIRLRHIGVVFQSNNLLPEFTARENVALPLMIRGQSRSSAYAAADTALASVRLADLGDRLPARMSGGQRQRVGIARALAGEQQLLLADEPTGALDSQNSRQLFALLRSLCDAHGAAVVLATHDPLAQDFATSTYQMVDGAVADR